MVYHCLLGDLGDDSPCFRVPKTWHEHTSNLRSTLTEMSPTTDEPDPSSENGMEGRWMMSRTIEENTRGGKMREDIGGSGCEIVRPVTLRGTQMEGARSNLSMCLSAFGLAGCMVHPSLGEVVREEERGLGMLLR